MYAASFQSLLVFDHVCRLGSQKAAAEALGVTPTAVSHAVKGLEARLSLKLLEKDGRTVRPTAAGELLAARLANGFNEIDLGLREVLERKKQVVVSVTPGFASLWLAPKVAKVVASGLSLPSFRLEASTVPADLDRADGPDLAVRYSREAKGQVLAQDRFVALYNPRLYPELASLADQVLLEVAWEQQGGANPQWADWFEAAAMDLPDACRIVSHTNEHAAIQAALAGGGVVLASTVLARDLLDLGLLEIYQPDISVSGPSYWLIKPASKRLSPEAQRVAKWISTEFESG
ncbi:MAG: LysR family transcriptional regulator [Parvularcula sp.]|jgi:DNA-binding transcriptional LysR family regulator|nr:LysR family transcriptional regulator [Parvularcula sp.]